MTDTLAWLERLYGKSPGYFAVTAFSGGKPRATKWFSTAELNAAAKTIVATGKGADVYVSVATHKEPQEKRGGENSVLSIPGFWADLDIGEEGHKPASLPNPPDEQDALAIIKDLPAPSLLMHSGGGLQAFWLFNEPWVFNEPIDKSAAKQASREWHALLEFKGKELGFHVDKTASLDRILRVPGTYNHKTESPRPVIAKELEGETHDLREMASLGIPEDEIPHAEPGNSEKGIEDNFPLSWDEILFPHGWTKCGENEKGSSLWSRPGKTCSEGHSATTNPYGVPVLVNFSATDELPSGPGQKLTKLKVWAYLNYNGDMKAAKTALKKLVKLTDSDITKIVSRFAETRINWETLWDEVDDEPHWLIEPLVEKGRQIAIFSEPKSGKSLAMLEWCLALASGKDPHSKEEGFKPVDVLYIDKENTKEDIRSRAGKMGYERQPLDRLHYYSFPDLAWLDTEQGGIELFALAKYHDAELVVIDTVSRTVEGEENSNDTYHDFYKYTGVKLKADGISLVRLDHAGKDAAKGMRGASSKATDVDEVWELLLVGENDIVLNRTHSRTNHGDSSISFTRVDTPTLRHEINLLPGTAQETAKEQIISILDQLSFPMTGNGSGINKAYEEVTKRVGTRFSKREVQEAQAFRKAASEGTLNSQDVSVTEHRLSTARAARGLATQKEKEHAEV